MPLTFLTTSHGKPYTAAGFGNWFRDQCVDAGVEFRAHGLRKAIVVRLVAQGVKVFQIAAMTGHKDLREIQLYAEKFDRELAAEQAMAALIGLPHPVGENTNTDLQTAVPVCGLGEKL